MINSSFIIKNSYSDSQEDQLDNKDSLPGEEMNSFFPRVNSIQSRLLQQLDPFPFTGGEVTYHQYVYQTAFNALPTMKKWVEEARHTTHKTHRSLAMHMLENYLWCAEQQASEKQKIATINWPVLDLRIRDEYQRVASIFQQSLCFFKASCFLVPCLDETSTGPIVGVASSEGWPVGVVNDQYIPREMNDYWLVHEVTYHDGGDVLQHGRLFGVFDGHVDATAAAHACNSFVSACEAALEQCQEEPLRDIYHFRALQKTYEKINATYEGKGGTTATVALMVRNELFISQVGDSRAIFVKADGTSIQVSEDAKPSLPHYYDQIQARGGEVIPGSDGIMRLNGCLSMATAIGDHDQPGISASPQIIKYPLPELEEGYLVIAAGIWSLMTVTQIGEQIKVMADKGYSPVEMASILLTGASNSGVADNVTILVVHFPSSCIAIQNEMSLLSPGKEKKEHIPYMPLNEEEWKCFHQMGIPQNVWQILEPLIRVKWRKLLFDGPSHKDPTRIKFNTILYQEIYKKRSDFTPEGEQYESGTTAYVWRKRHQDQWQSISSFYFEKLHRADLSFDGIQDWQWNTLISHMEIPVIQDGVSPNLLVILNTLILECMNNSHEEKQVAKKNEKFAVNVTFIREKWLQKLIAAGILDIVGRVIGMDLVAGLEIDEKA